MKFSEYPYTRPDTEALKTKLTEGAAKIAAAGSADEQIAVFDALTMEKEEFYTLASIAYVRNSVDTRDEFYDGEREYFDEVGPELEEADQAVKIAMLNSAFRPELEAHYGSLLFKNMEIARRSFTPELIPLMQEESKLVAQYEKLYAAITVEFDGKTMPLPMLGSYRESADRATRRAAYEVQGKAFDALQAELDEIYDKLVKNRNAQGRMVGYENYIQLGYDRLGRNCYGKEELAAFRDQIAKDLVPIVAKVKEAQKKRIGVDRICIYDDDFRSPEGNAAPDGTAEEILAAGRKMYRELSPETAEFIDFMYDNELFDVLSREGKVPGGYCTGFDSYKAPFIFSNFNGTAGDVDVLTHEAGHAFQYFRAVRSDVHPLLREAPMETCECHSMSMEFLTQDFHHLFFGDKTAKYELQHCEGSLDFIPYGCMVDEFQHRMYENEDLTPAERNAVWQELEQKYRPWMDMDGLPFYSRYSHWQWKPHIYSSPLYYIDYCIAQTVAFQFWTRSLENRAEAWKRYLAFVDFAGTKPFDELCRASGLRVPYEPGCIAAVGEGIGHWLEQNS